MPTLPPISRRRALAFAACAALPARAQTSADALLAAAVDGAHRSPAYRQRDAARHPLETLRFLGIQPGHQVIELAPGGGWYTEILAYYLRERGQLHAAHYARDDPNDGRRKSRAAFEQRLAADPALYGRVKLGTLPTPPAWDRMADIAPPGGADAVLTFRNIHNWLEEKHLDESLRTFARALKPGGIFGVEEHRAAPGTPLAQMMASGYVTEDLVIERARAAGLNLVERSEINANPRDTKDHPKGVWALPPTLRNGEVDRDKYLAIGESDRFTHRYAKAG
ncbi:MAG: class I SAM-dependent methyltransferase [Burkholderiaceae bacterium]|nr:class I SAM-dependent methyltransferase [Burkholderiaceae bacterium]